MGGPGSGPRPGQRNRAGTGKGTNRFYTGKAKTKVGIKKDIRAGKLGKNRKYNYSTSEYSKGDPRGQHAISKYNLKGNSRKGRVASIGKGMGRRFKARR